jgi:hypothetical protein
MAVPVVKGVVWVGIVGAMAYIFLTVGRLLEGIDLRYVLTAIRSIRPPGLALAVAAMIPARVLAAMFGEKAPVLTARRYIGDVILLGSSRPMLFAVSAIVYFGPLLLLLLHPAVRARFFAGIRALGPGWCLFILGVVGLSLNSESRHSIFGYPAVVILLAAAASQAGISARVTWCIAVLAVALSKLWLRINLEPQNMVDTTVPATAWNYRRYFMNHGPWMSNEAYVLHVVVVAIAAVAVWAALRTRTSRESPARS